MNFFDIIFVAIVLLFVLFSSSKGSLREILSVLSIVAGYFAAEQYHQKYTHITLQYLSDGRQAKIVTYLAIFAACVIIGILLSTIVKILFSFKRPTVTSRILGGVFGLIKGVLICLLIFFVVENYIPSYVDDLYNSVFSPWFQNLRSVINGINLA